MNESSSNLVWQPLHQLTRRIRWIRWLRNVHRFLWALISSFFLVFLADALFGLSVFDLRIASVVLLALALILAGVDWLLAWQTRLDLVGVAHLLEKSYPALAERLITLVQLQSEAVTSANPAFISLLQKETGEQIASVNVETACPLKKERRAWIKSAGILAGLAVMLSFFPAFGQFTSRFCTAWITPLVPFALEVPAIEPPVLTAKPLAVVVAPKYQQAPSRTMVFDEQSQEQNTVLLYSRMQFQISLSRMPVKGFLKIRPVSSAEQETSHLLLWEPGNNYGISDVPAAFEGTFVAELFLELEHHLSVTLPVGRWTVYRDQPPVFTHALRLHGQTEGTPLGEKQARISPDDLLRLHAEVEDNEGLQSVAIEYRVNDEPVQMLKRIDAAGKKQVNLDERLILPKTLKQGDLVRCRVRALDNRLLKRGEVLNAGLVLPPSDLLPQVTVSPVGEHHWIELRVDRSVAGFVKEQIQQQSEEIASTIAKIKQELENEVRQMQKLNHVSQQQGALNTEQRQHAGKIRALNQRIVEELAAAGKKLTRNPDLENLAAHFFDIADTEMQKSDQAVQRFSQNASPSEREQESASAQQALLQAQKKLDRILEWNKLLAEDRLDQWQLEKLAAREKGLADRLEELLAKPLSDEKEMARQLKEIRDEQTRLAKEMAKLQEQSKLLQQALAEMQQQRVQKLAQTAEQLARQQLEMQKVSASAEQMPPELAELLKKLAKRQEDLANRVEPYAKNNEGPEVGSVREAAVSLKKAELEKAIEHQKKHEKQLQEWRDKLLPGPAPKTLREAALRLAKEQQLLHADLEKLGTDLPRLTEQMLKQRLKELVARQTQLAATTAKLDVDPKEAKLKQAHDQAERIVRQAAEQLSAKDALTAFETMEKGQQALQALGGLLPETPLKDRSEVKDPEVRARVERVEKFADEQKLIRQDTEKLLAAWMKVVDKMVGEPLREKTEKLASELNELSQKGIGPEAKSMAKEAAQTADMAKKGMEASQELAEKGNKDQAKMLQEEAGKQLELVARQLEKLAQDKKQMPSRDAEKTAESLQESTAKMRLAEKNLPANPKKAQSAMNVAAQQMEETAARMNKQSKQRVPQPTRDPAQKAGPFTAGSGSSVVPPLFKIDETTSKAWGELPGELKTRMLQDYRTRYGDEQAELIQNYFERLGEKPRKIP